MLNTRFLLLIIFLFDFERAKLKIISQKKKLFLQCE